MRLADNEKSNKEIVIVETKGLVDMDVPLCVQKAIDY